MSTYTPIASVTLSSAQSSVTFSGIPQTYTDLVLVANLGHLTTDQGTLIQFNGDSGTNYSLTNMYGNGSSVASARGTSRSTLPITYYVVPNDSYDHNVTVNIMNYSNSTTYKTVLSRSNRASANNFPGAEAIVGLWRSTAAISSIVITTSGGNIKSGSTFNLYGVANASITNVAKATGGDSVYTDGTYWYHIFRSSGTFTPTQALTADYLVVAGGGAGGSNQGGGGGAGGLRCTVGATGGGGSLESALSLSAQAYTITIGAGGTGVYQTVGTAGSNSVFATITSTGGAAGAAARSGTVPTTGGSGGGGSASNGGAGTANQGYAGGNAFGSAFNNHASGGGGGAGAVGSNGTNTPSLISGNGGNGVTTTISGTSTTYAGGGGGGAFYSGVTAGNGGTGGGANGSANDIQPTAATANTGGGGGGCGGQITGGTGGAGGSGIVIVRYAA